MSFTVNKVVNDQPTSSSVTDNMLRHRHRGLAIRCAGIFLLTFLVRLVFIKLFAASPVNDLLWNDAVGWNLANGLGFTASRSAPYIPGVFRTPGYPAFLALVYTISGHSYSAVYLCQGLVDSFSAVLIFLAARELLPLVTATVTGALYACYPYSSIFCGILHQDILLTFLVILILYLVVRAIQGTAGAGRWFVIGLGIGVAVMVKPLFAAFIVMPGVVALIAVAQVREKVIRLSALALGAILVVAPWIVRNYLVFHSFPPLAVGGTGTNLTYLMIELKGGEAELISRSTGTDSGAGQASGYMDKFVDGAALIEIEKSLAKEAASGLARQWPQYLLLVVKHIPRLWLTRFTIGRNQLIAKAALGVSIFYLVFGVLGMYLLRHQWRKLLPLYVTIVLVTLMYAPYTAEARYTLPARPVMIVFVSASLVLAARKLGALRLKGAA